MCAVVFGVVVGAVPRGCHECSVAVVCTVEGDEEVVLGGGDVGVCCAFPRAAAAGGCEVVCVCSFRKEEGVGGGVCAVGCAVLKGFAAEVGGVFSDVVPRGVCVPAVVEGLGVCGIAQGVVGPAEGGGEHGFGELAGGAAEGVGDGDAVV